MKVREYIKDNPDVTITKVKVLGKDDVTVEEALDMHIIMSSHNNPKDSSLVELTVC